VFALTTGVSAAHDAGNAVDDQVEADRHGRERKDRGTGSSSSRISPALDRPIYSGSATIACRPVHCTGQASLVIALAWGIPGKSRVR
jgi:hypothetical protein